MRSGATFIGFIGFAMVDSFHWFNRLFRRAFVEIQWSSAVPSGLNRMWSDFPALKRPG